MTDVDSHEEAQAPFVRRESREELLKDGVADVLHPRTHPHSLCSDVDRENLCNPVPCRRAPRRLVEEREQEEKEGECNSHGLLLRARCCVGISVPATGSAGSFHSRLPTC